MAITTICFDCKKVMSVEESQYETYTYHSVCLECQPKKVIKPYCYEIDRERGYWIVFDEWGNPVESFGQEEDAWDLTEHLNKEAGYGNASGIHGNVNC